MYRERYFEARKVPYFSIGVKTYRGVFMINQRALVNEFISLTMHMIAWNRTKLEKTCNVNGRSNEGALTIRQFHVMMYIHRTKAQTVSMIAAWFGISKSSMSIMLTKLEKLGYLYKEHTEDREDGRKVYFRLTDAGKMVLQKTEEQILENIEMCFSVFDAKQSERFYTLLQELHTMLKIAGGREE